MESKQFTPNFNKKLFTIKVEVFENCSTIIIEANDDYKPTYHEVIGSLETNKHAMMDSQKEQNKKEFKKQNKKK